MKNIHVLKTKTKADGRIKKINLQLFTKKPEIKQLRQIADKFKMTPEERHEYGDYIEKIKGILPNNTKFTWSQLEGIAQEYLGEKHNENPR